MVLPSGTVRCSMLCAFSNCDVKWYVPSATVLCRMVESSWNVMAHGDAREGKWRGNWRMECVASTLHTTSEHGVSSITIADAHTSAASSRLNWRPRRLKMDSSVSPKDEIWFLRVCHHIWNVVYVPPRATETYFKHCQFRPTGDKSYRVSFGRNFFLGRDNVCLTHTSLRMVQCCIYCAHHTWSHKFKKKTSSVHWPLTRTSI